MSLLLKVLTPERKVLEAEADSVVVEAIDGEVGILNQHVPMMTSLKPCVSRYKTPDGKTNYVAIMGGLLETDGQTVTILASSAELADDLDALRAEQAKSRAEARLHERHDKVDVDRAKLALARALTRIKLNDLIRANLVK